MNVRFSEGYEPATDFTVDIEVGGVTVRVQGLNLISEIGALALRRHPVLFGLVQKAVCVVPVDVEAAIEERVEARWREDIKAALFPLMEPK